MIDIEMRQNETLMHNPRHKWIVQNVNIKNSK